MIKVENDTVTVKGTGLDILAEIALVIASVAESAGVSANHIVARLALALADLDEKKEA